MVQVTKSTKSISQNDIERAWQIIDLDGKILGRVANEIATLLMGKGKVKFSPNMDMGDHVVVINARKVLLSENKAAKKEYTLFSGYPGGLRTVSYKAMMEKKPTEIIRHAVSGMLPKNKLRDPRLARLHIFPNDQHTFAEKFNK
ncbi:MAG: 50S ribosomal protein L13 [Patescibacteria group bacterium]